MDVERGPGLEEQIEASAELVRSEAVEIASRVESLEGLREQLQEHFQKLESLADNSDQPALWMAVQYLLLYRETAHSRTDFEDFRSDAEARFYELLNEVATDDEQYRYWEDKVGE